MNIEGMTPRERAEELKRLKPLLAKTKATADSLREYLLADADPVTGYVMYEGVPVALKRIGTSQRQVADLVKAMLTKGQLAQVTKTVESLYLDLLV